VLNREPPQDVDAERAVLGSILLNPQALAVVASDLTAEDFYSEAHRDIYRAMCEIAEQDNAVDATILMSHMQQAGTLERAGGASYLAQLTGATMTSHHVERYAATVLDRAHRRKLLTILSKQTAMVWQSKADDIALNLIREVEGVGIQQGREAAYVPELVGEHTEAFERYLEKTALDRVQGYRLGIWDLDRWIPNGLENDMLMVVAAKSSHGKSTFLLNMAHNIGMAYGPPLLCSLEEKRARIMRRLHRIVCPLDEFVDAHADWGRRTTLLQRALPRLRDVPIFIQDGYRTIEELKFSVQAHVQRHPETSFVAFDYFQAVQTTKRFYSGKERYDHIISEIGALRDRIARPIVLLSQFVKADFGNDGPQLWHLRETSRIENDADIILMLWNTAQENETDIEVRCHIAKQRDGPTRSVTLRWYKPSYVITSIQHPRKDGFESEELFDDNGNADEGVPF